MNIFAISDLHISLSADKPMDIFGGQWVNYLEKIFLSWEENVKDGDVVLLCGDLSWAMKLADAKADIELLAKLKGRKVIIRGNHDYWFSGISKVRKELPPDFYALQNDCIKFDNIIICGTRAWTVPEGPNVNDKDKKIYLREAERLKLSFNQVNKIRREGDILICMFHYPPFNSRRENSLFTLEIEKNRVDKVVYGHLHGKSGRIDLITNKNGIDYYLTSCDLMGNKLIKIL